MLSMVQLATIMSTNSGDNFFSEIIPMKVPMRHLYNILLRTVQWETRNNMHRVLQIIQFPAKYLITILCKI